MKPFQYLLFTVLSIFTVYASAADHTTSSETGTVVKTEKYNYGENLDIARVVRITNAADTSTACGPVTAHMVYVDSKGVTHDLEYTRFGDGCQNG